jgi:putative LysE/RhtB family amino acid efflux pump
MGFALIKGFWLGLSIAAPLGPIGLLVLRQALQGGVIAGIASGMGVALADALYGVLAVLGIRLAAGLQHQVAFAGALFLLWTAWRTWRTRPQQDCTTANRWTGPVSTFLLTIANPLTIVLFAAMVSTAGATSPAAFIAGVFLGSMCWWIILSSAASRLRPVLIEHRGVMNRLSAVTLSGFALWALGAALQK